MNKDTDYLNKLSKFLEHGVHPIIQIGASLEEVEQLKIFPIRSISVMLYADETYEPKINKQIANCNSIHSVIRPYPIWKFSILQLNRWLAKSFLEFFAICKVSGLAKSFKFTISGLEMLRRQLFISIRYRLAGKNLINMHLGYTDTFAKNYLNALPKSKLSVPEFNESLFAFASENRNYFFKLKKSKISFMGQAGNAERRLAISLLKNYRDARVTVRTHFKGSQSKTDQDLKSIDYLKECFESSIVLCPPGNYSGLSFRISEALCAGAFPLVVSSSLTDPLFPGSKVKWKRVHLEETWKNSLKQILEMAPNQIMDLWEREITEIIRGNAEVSERLRILLESIE